MRDREEQVNYDICKSAQQDEASYNNKSEERPRSLQRAEEEEMKAMESKTPSIVEKG